MKLACMTIGASAATVLVLLSMPCAATITNIYISGTLETGSFDSGTFVDVPTQMGGLKFSIVFSIDDTKGVITFDPGFSSGIFDSVDFAPSPISAVFTVGGKDFEVKGDRGGGPFQGDLTQAAVFRTHPDAPFNTSYVKYIGDVFLQTGGVVRNIDPIDFRTPYTGGSLLGSLIIGDQTYLSWRDGYIEGFVTGVPEPTSALLMLSGIAVCGVFQAMRRMKEFQPWIVVE